MFLWPLNFTVSCPVNSVPPPPPPVPQNYVTKKSSPHANMHYCFFKLSPFSFVALIYLKVADTLSLIFPQGEKKTDSSMNSICIYLQSLGENRNNQNTSINRSFISLIFAKFPQTQAILPKVKFSSVICSVYSPKSVFILHSHSKLQHVLQTVSNLCLVKQKGR